MLSIGKMVAGAEGYYLRTVAAGREEYYTGSGEAPGYWIGTGSPELDLFDEVAPEHLRAVLAGVAPDGRVLTQGRVDPARRVSGFDLTFSAPKSVSLLYGLGDLGTAGAVREAHAHAVDDALGYLERHALRVRRGAGGGRSLPAQGLVGAAFVHRTSRAGDPQLHTHVLVANVTAGADGAWSAPDARLLYRHARTAGFVYQAVLRATLTDRLGVRFGPVTQGMAELTGVSPRLLRAFSTRRAAIEAHLAESGGTSRRAGEVAALATRPAKVAGPATSVPEATQTLRDRWFLRLVDLGFERAELTGALGRHVRAPFGPREVEETATRFLGPEGLTAQHSTFERRDVVRAAASVPDGATVAELDEISRVVLSHPEMVELGSAGHGGEPRLTTAELLATERRLLAGALARRGEGAAVVPEATLTEALGRQASLSDEQAAMVRRLATSGDGVEVVVGQAGTGKTTALGAACRAWEAAGLTPIGTALSARAAQGLGEGVGIPAMTLARLQMDIGRGTSPLTGRSVVVVDEAGMVGTRALERLARAAGDAGAKVVLVGDPRQLPEIEAGGMLAALVSRLGAAQLTENRRQVEAWEREALAQLRHGSVGEGVGALVDAGRVHVAPTADAARRELVAAWLGHVGGGGESVMLAATRRDVAALNELARSALRENGILGPDVVTVGETGFALGDQVVCGRNDAGLGVLNGTTGTVKAVAGDALVVENSEGRRSLPFDYVEAGHLTHGYALTVHKAQGATVDRAFVLATASLTRESGYVAMSRARRSTELFVPAGALADGGPGEQPHAAIDRRPEPIDALTERLGRSSAKTLAVDEMAPLPLPPAPIPWEGGRPTNDAYRIVPARTAGARYLEAVMGRRPHFADEARDYDRLAGALSAYRNRYGVTGDDALGPPPLEVDRRLAYDTLSAELHAYGRRLGRSLEPPERGLGL